MTDQPEMQLYIREELSHIYLGVSVKEGPMTRVSGTRLAHVWYTSVTRLAHVWYKPGTRLVHIWHTSGTYTSGTRLVHVWHTSGTRLAHVSEIQVLHQ